jgi:ATPase subunit of ABC transporter with duplicated ATPase domains
VTSAPLIELDAVEAGYTERVVGPVSLSVAPGQTVGLAGPNGCGKTTLVNAILGDARLFGGAVRRADGLRVTVQRQHPVRLDELPLTGRELLRVARADRRALPPSILPFVERRVDRLSGGQFQLLQVWACLAGPSDLVILDEPTTNMDPRSKASLLDILRASPASLGVLTISHDRELLEVSAARIVSIAP